MSIKKTLTTPVIFVAASIIWLLFVQDYAGGYGKITDGKVDTSFREKLGFIMFQEYKKDDGTWSFGYMVPAFVFFVYWIKRKEWRSTELKPANVSGILILLIGFSSYWVGYLGHQKYLGYFGLQIVLLGSIVWFLGWRWFANLFWCWVLMGMVWPWRLLIEKVSTPLQFMMAKLTTAYLNFTGAGAVQNGSAVLAKQKDYVDNQLISLDIDVACSGMRSLFALILLGLILLSISFKEEWKKWFFILFIPAIAIFSNFVRMLMLYYGNLHFGSEFAIGTGEGEESGYHIISGLVVFAVSLVLMMLLIEIINKGKSVFKKKKVRTVIK